jgi:ribose 5-phosphate isomerase A
MLVARMRELNLQASRNESDHAKLAAASAAVKLIQPYSRVAVGTGSTIEACLPELARIPGVVVTPTSGATENRAVACGIRLAPLGDSYDFYIDGADQVSPGGHVLKGSWGAHVREKCLAMLSRRRILVCDERKLVSVLVGPVPIAVIPHFAGLYQEGEMICLDENGLALVPIDAGCPIMDPAGWNEAMHGKPGVVATGLFPTGFVDEIVVGHAGGRVEIIRFARS